MIKKKVSLLRAGEAKFSVAMSMTLQYVFSRAFVDALYAVVGVRDAYRHQTARGGLCVPSTAQTLHRPTMISRHTPKIIQLLGSHRKVRASKVSGRYAGRIGRGCHDAGEPSMARSVKMDVVDKSKVSRFALWGLRYQNRV